MNCDKKFTQSSLKMEENIQLFVEAKSKPSLSQNFITFLGRQINFVRFQLSN
jgi:hypothetical protein